MTAIQIAFSVWFYGILILTLTGFTLYLIGEFEELTARNK